MSAGKRWRSGRASRFLLSAFVIGLVAGLWPVVAAAPAKAADATMTFAGALNVAGLLSGVTVRPAVVTIPAGGEVTFANATSETLTVTVGGRSALIPPGGFAAMRFTGAAAQETFVATATILDPALVGSLTSSVGRVVVQALPPAADAAVGAVPRAATSAASAAPPRPGAASTGPDPSPSGAPSASASEPPKGAVVPLAPGAARSGMAKPGRSAGAGDRPNGVDQSGKAARRSPNPGAVAKARPAPVLPPFPGFSSTHDQLGLVLLLSAAVFAGLVAALVRTVLAYRPLVLVGAHSQAARKAVRLRRGR